MAESNWVAGTSTRIRHNIETIPSIKILHFRGRQTDGDQQSAYGVEARSPDSFSMTDASHFLTGGRTNCLELCEAEFLG